MSLIGLHSFYGNISVLSHGNNVMQHLLKIICLKPSHYFYGQMVNAVTVYWFVETEECTEHDTVPKYNMLYFLLHIKTVKG